MIKLIHKIATYTAVILISSMPLSSDLLADSKNEHNSVTSFSSTEENLNLKNRNGLEKK